MNTRKQIKSVTEPQFKSRFGLRVRRHSAALALLTGATMPAADALARSAPPKGTEPCVLCAPGLDVPVVRLAATYFDSVAQSHASFNATRLAQIDSLLQTGYFGPPDEDKSRGGAHLMARISTVNAYRDLMRLACDPDHVYEVDGAALRGLYERYSDVNLFIGVCLERLRMGQGRVCARYSIDKGRKGVCSHGGRQMRWRVKNVKVDGYKRRLLNVFMPTGNDGEVELFLAPHHTFTVEYNRSDGPPAPFEWFLVDNIEGAWLRKWGMHRPKAYMFWVSTYDGAVATGATGRNDAVVALAAAATTRRPAAGLPTTPLVGLRIYIPGLRLRMPLFPDIKVEDLREVVLAMPILDMNYVRREQYPSWLQTNENLGFKDWKGFGPLPPEIRRRFPNR